MTRKLKVNVIGAGVTGLTTALVLQRNGYQVQILAEHWPGDLDINYASPWACAYWKTNFYNIDPKVIKLESISFKTLWTLSHIHDTGLIRVPSVDYLDEKPALEGDPWNKELASKFRVLPPRKLPSGVKYGISFITISMHVPKYLRWLLNQFINAGGRTHKTHLTHINEAFNEDADIVVNCTGINARTLGGVQDETVYPTKGQTVVVWAPHIKKAYTRTSINSVSYIVPRENGEVILGGTTEVNDFTEKPDPRNAEAIIQRCVELCPELTYGRGIQNLQIISHNVGRRPSRINGIRLETEIRKNTQGKDIIICHNYGHHSYGYNMSWGASLEVLELIEAAVKAGQGNAKLSSRL